MTDGVTELWPTFGLLIATPRLTLRLPSESDLSALAHAARVIGPSGQRQFQLPWMYQPSPAMERQLAQRHWRALAEWQPENWHLPLAVYLDEHPIGIQAIWAADFARRRSVGTGSWITFSKQGQGYGTEARTAVLELAFAHLGAQEASTEYLEGNHASARIGRKLGYQDNGQHLVYSDDAGRTTEYRLRLDRGTWLSRRDDARPIVTGIAPCLPMFGVTS